MFLALEPVTLRAWCLEWIIYNSDITNSLLILCLANLRCQISLPNFKRWCGQRSGAEVMKWYSWTMWGIYQWAIDWWFAIGQSDLLHSASALSSIDSSRVHIKNLYRKITKRSQEMIFLFCWKHSTFFFFLQLLHLCIHPILLSELIWTHCEVKGGWSWETQYSTPHVINLLTSVLLISARMHLRGP